jgi:hypothetical protein
MQQQHTNSFDEGFAELLRRNASPISRRSMLGRGVKLLMGLAGISLVGLGSIPLLADVPGWGRRGKKTNSKGQSQDSIPTGFDPTCGNLHGVLCSGNCSPTAPGASDCLQSDLSIKQAAWVGCCKRTDTQQFQCYTMADVVCATRPTNWLVNCPGNTPTGRIWFGGKLRRRLYVCTIPTAVGNQFATGSDCALKCTPDIYPNTWLC